MWLIIWVFKWTLWLYPFLHTEQTNCLWLSCVFLWFFSRSLLTKPLSHLSHFWMSNVELWCLNLMCCLKECFLTSSLQNWHLMFSCAEKWFLVLCVLQSQSVILLHTLQLYCFSPMCLLLWTWSSFLTFASCGQIEQGYLIPWWIAFFMPLQTSRRMEFLSADAACMNVWPCRTTMILVGVNFKRIWEIELCIAQFTYEGPFFSMGFLVAFEASPLKKIWDCKFHTGK